MTLFGKYINHTNTVCQVQERLLSLASCMIYIYLIVNELYRENLVKHVNFYIAMYVFDTIWASAWDFQQFGMCDQQSLRPACAYAQSDQSLCLSLEYSMIVKLLTECHLEFLNLKGGCTGSSESTLVKMSNCWKSHALAHLMFDEHIMPRQEVCLGQLFPLNELSLCVFCFQCRGQGGPGVRAPPPPRRGRECLKNWKRWPWGTDRAVSVLSIGDKQLDPPPEIVAPPPLKNVGSPLEPR